MTAAATPPTPTARHRAVRQSDVARLAGVSQSAVSRVITCSRIPNRIDRPSSSASLRTRPIFSATPAGGSPQVR